MKLRPEVIILGNQYVCAKFDTYANTDAACFTSSPSAMCLTCEYTTCAASKATSAGSSRSARRM